MADAQAKGVTRTTFISRGWGHAHQRDRSHAGSRSTASPSVIMSTRLFQTAVIADAQLKAREWAKLLTTSKRNIRSKWGPASLGLSPTSAPKKIDGTSFAAATLAYVKYRHLYFRNELIVAMLIMQNNHFTRDRWSAHGRRHGSAPVHAVELRRLCRRFFRRWPHRH